MSCCQKPTQPAPSFDESHSDTSLPYFPTTWSVALHCDACVESVTSVLKPVSGIRSVHCDIEDNIVTIEGNIPPSRIVQLLRDAGKDAILRGSGQSDSAAVAMLQVVRGTATKTTPTVVEDESSGKVVKGLARLIQVAPNYTIVDATVQGWTPNKTLYISVRQYGVLLGVSESGGVFNEAISSLNDTADAPKAWRGYIGSVTTDETGCASFYGIGRFDVYEIIGRGFLITPVREILRNEQGDCSLLADRQHDHTSTALMGVIARSAGIWDNRKTVCSCSGKTVWEERKDAIAKGVL